MIVCQIDMFWGFDDQFLAIRCSMMFKGYSLLTLKSNWYLGIQNLEEKQSQKQKGKKNEVKTYQIYFHTQNQTMSTSFSKYPNSKAKSLRNRQPNFATIDDSLLRSPKRRKSPTFFLPPIENSKNQDDLIRLKQQIIGTVRKLGDKIFVPHNAAKKRNLDLIKKRRGSQFKIQKATKSFSLRNDTVNSEKSGKEISLDEKMQLTRRSDSNKNQIASCTIQQSIFYG